MSRYLYANRRHAICLYGNPILSNGYMPPTIGGGGLVIQPDEGRLPLNSFSRNEFGSGLFGGVQSTFPATIGSRSVTIFGCHLYGFLEESAGQFAVKRISFRRGREMPGACFSGSIALSTLPTGMNGLEYDAAFRKYAMFVEKTDAGWGTNYWSVTASKVDSVPIKNASPPPLLYPDSLAYLTLWNGQQAVARTVIPFSTDSFDSANRMFVRGGLARAEDGQTKIVVQAVSPVGVVASLEADYSPPSEDACLFGLVQEQGATLDGTLVWAGIADRRLSGTPKAMRFERIDHDKMVPVAFESGVIGFPNFTAGSLGAFGIGQVSGRQQWTRSRFAHQPNTGNLVSCNRRGQPSPDAEGDSTTLAPILDYIPAGPYGKAVRVPVATEPVKARSLAFKAFSLDTSGMEEHAAKLYALRQGSAIHILGSSFTSVELELIARTQGIWLSNPDDYASGVLYNGTEELNAISLRQLFLPRWRKGQQVLRDVFEFPPLGQYTLSPLQIGGIPSAPGVVSCNVDISHAEQTSVVSSTRLVFSFVAATTVTDVTTTRVSAQTTGNLFAWFDVGLQESGIYQAPPVDGPSSSDDVAVAKYGVTTPESPQGKILGISHFTGNQNPSPVLRMHLMGRTVTTRSQWSQTTLDIYNQAGQYSVGSEEPIPISVSNPNHVDTEVVSLGVFQFNKQQTQLLASGQAVAPTTWQTNPQSPTAVKIDFEMERNVPVIAPSPTVWLEIKSLRLT